MNEIPSFFWMIIISGLSILFGVILFYIAMLIRETIFTVREVTNTLFETRQILKTSKQIVADTTEIVSTLKTSLNEINDEFIAPLKRIGGIVSSITSMIEKFTGR